MGLYYFALVLGIVLTVVLLAVLIVSEGRLSDGEFAAVFFCFIFAMVCCGAFFYGVGDRHGAIETARGHYKTYYLYDKDGKISDTIAEFPH